MSVQITRDAAVALFSELGITSANKWNAKRMAAKLAKIDEMVDDDTNIEDEEVDGTLTTVLEAIENEEDIEVLSAAASKKASKPAAKDAEADDDEDDTVPVKETAAQKKKRLAAEKKAAKEAEAEDDEDGDGEDDAEPEETEAAKKKRLAKEKKDKEKAEADAKKVPGVRETRTRPFLAGVVIKNHGGLKAGVTEQMVQELDEMYGKENPAESMFTLRNAWHAIRGFQNGEGEDGAGDSVND